MVKKDLKRVSPWSSEAHVSCLALFLFFLASLSACWLSIFLCCVEVQLALGEAIVCMRATKIWYPKKRRRASPEVSSHFSSHTRRHSHLPSGLLGGGVSSSLLFQANLTLFPLHQARASREALLGLPSRSPKGEELPRPPSPSSDKPHSTVPR